MADGIPGEKHWRVVWNHEDGVFAYDLGEIYNYGVPVFASKESAQACVAAIGKDRLKKYYFGVEE